MSDEIKKDKNLDLSARVDEFNNIKFLIDQYGSSAYKAIEKYYRNSGYEAGFEKLLKMSTDKKITKESILKDPVKTVEFFLVEFFKERGGNLPEIWSDNDTVYLKTERSIWCPTPTAREKSGIFYRDVCHIHKRAFVKGFLEVIAEFVPEIIINSYNKSSRTNDEVSDCVEAFQVVSP